MSRVYSVCPGSLGATKEKDQVSLDVCWWLRPRPVAPRRRLLLAPPLFSCVLRYTLRTHHTRKDKRRTAGAAFFLKKELKERIKKESARSPLLSHTLRDGGSRSYTRTSPLENARTITIYIQGNTFLFSYVFRMIIFLFKKEGPRLNLGVRFGLSVTQKDLSFKNSDQSTFFLKWLFLQESVVTTQLLKGGKVAPSLREQTLWGVVYTHILTQGVSLWTSTHLYYLETLRAPCNRNFWELSYRFLQLNLGRHCCKFTTAHRSRIDIWDPVYFYSIYSSFKSRMKRKLHTFFLSNYEWETC